MTTKLFPSLSQEQHIALAVAAITVNQLEWLIEHLVEARMPEQKNIAKEMLTGNGFDRFLNFAKAIRKIWVRERFRKLTLIPIPSQAILPDSSGLKRAGRGLLPDWVRYKIAIHRGKMLVINPLTCDQN